MHHVLIWSRKRCSFLISFFRSPSNFSFCAACSASYTCTQEDVRHALRLTGVR